MIARGGGEAELGAHEVLKDLAVPAGDGTVGFIEMMSWKSAGLKSFRYLLSWEMD